jgi:4,5-DOPA dioxygenase extradiol
MEVGASLEWSLRDFVSAPTQPVIITPSKPGGPLPVLGDPSHANLTAALRALPGRLALSSPPKAILLCSAHFEAAQPTVIATPTEKLLYDYGGFPPESYRLKYNPPGDPRVAESILQLLR